MMVKAKVKVFQEAMSNMLPPTAVQAATLSNMLLSIYGGLWWHMFPSSDLVLSHKQVPKGVNNR
jgi:hypothetical protein